MGKLNIAHHKSYHPYRGDNIERVRRDEQEAQDKETHEEGRIMLADSEARIGLLRERAGGAKRKKRITPAEEIDQALATQAASTSTPSSGLNTSGGHINFFADLENNNQAIADAVAKSRDKKMQTDADRGVALAPTKKDMKPWYASGKSSHEDEPKEGAADDELRAAATRKRRDENAKSRSDPLTSINSHLASPSSSNPSSSRPNFRYPPRPAPSDGDPARASRLERESSERERARELIARRRREMEGSETPGSVFSGVGGRDHADVYNWQETVEAQGRRRQRDREWGQRRW